MRKTTIHSKDRASELICLPLPLLLLMFVRWFVFVFYSYTKIVVKGMTKAEMILKVSVYNQNSLI